MLDKSANASSYGYDDLIEMGHGRLLGGEARLPLPPMLMFDRIVSVEPMGEGGGRVRAELDVRPDLWFFACHFEEDPVMPGCLGLDAMWQLVGFYLTWSGGPGYGRALGVGDVKFSGQVLPDVKKVEYDITVKRLVKGRLWVGMADGTMAADGKVIYRATDLKVGLFKKAASVVPADAREAVA